MGGWVDRLREWGMVIKGKKPKSLVHLVDMAVIATNKHDRIRAF